MDIKKKISIDWNVYLHINKIKIDKIFKKR